MATASFETLSITKTAQTIYRSAAAAMGASPRLSAGSPELPQNNCWLRPESDYCLKNV